MKLHSLSLAAVMAVASFSTPALLPAARAQAAPVAPGAQSAVTTAAVVRQYATSVSYTHLDVYKRQVW